MEKMKRTALIIGLAIILQMIAISSNSDKTIKSESDLLFRHYTVLNKIKGAPSFIEEKEDNYSDWIYVDTSPNGFDIDYIYMIDDEGIIYSILIAMYPEEEVINKEMPGQKL
jgi:hypothetical protein